MRRLKNIINPYINRCDNRGERSGYIQCTELYDQNFLQIKGKRRTFRTNK